MNQECGIGYDKGTVDSWQSKLADGTLEPVNWITETRNILSSILFMSLHDPFCRFPPSNSNLLFVSFACSHVHVDWVIEWVTGGENPRSGGWNNKPSLPVRDYDGSLNKLWRYCGVHTSQPPLAGTNHCSAEQTAFELPLKYALQWFSGFYLSLHLTILSNPTEAPQWF